MAEAGNAAQNGGLRRAVVTRDDGEQPPAALPTDGTAAASRDGSVVVPVREGGLDAYEVGRAIGKGKFSTVFKARRKADGSVVALKKIKIFDMMDAKSRDKCFKEIGLVERLEHPNIIKYIEAFIDRQRLVLVFQFAEAGDLKRQIRKARERGARFDERMVWRFFSQIADAVRYMHSQRVMHRDLKPANIFLMLDGTVKVGDLGLGRSFSQDTMLARSKVGTPLYMSGEVLRGHGYDFASDVWSCGCILYELAMLKSPFKEEGLDLVGLFRKISKGEYPPVSSVYTGTLRQLVGSMLQLDPEKRPGMDRVWEIAAYMRDHLGRAHAPVGLSHALEAVLPLLGYEGRWHDETPYGDGLPPGGQSVPPYAFLPLPHTASGARVAEQLRLAVALAGWLLGPGRAAEGREVGRHNLPGVDPADPLGLGGLGANAAPSAVQMGLRRAVEAVTEVHGAASKGSDAPAAAAVRDTLLQSLGRRPAASGGDSAPLASTLLLFALHAAQERRVRPQRFEPGMASGGVGGVGWSDVGGEGAAGGVDVEDPRLQGVADRGEETMEWLATSQGIEDLMRAQGASGRPGEVEEDGGALLREEVWQPASRDRPASPQAGVPFSASADPAAAAALALPMAASVDAGLWRAEAERVGPRLARAGAETAAAARAGGSQWRQNLHETRLLLSQLSSSKTRSVSSGGSSPATSGSTAAERVRETLARLQRSAWECLDRVGKFEERTTRLESRPGGLLASLQELRKRRSDAGECAASLQQRVAKQASELSGLQSTLEGVSEAMQDRSDAMTDGSPLVRLKRALASMESELRQLDVRIGLSTARLFRQQQLMGERRLELAVEGGSSDGEGSKEDGDGDDWEVRA